MLACRRCIKNSIFFGKLKIDKRVSNCSFEFVWINLQVHQDANESQLVEQELVEPALCHKSEAFQSHCEENYCPAINVMISELENIQI